jgi:DNA-binding beta-propeller fold protein YncE
MLTKLLRWMVSGDMSFFGAVICIILGLTNAQRGHVTTLAGSGDGEHADGTGVAAGFIRPGKVAVSPDGMALYVGNHDFEHCIRKVAVATGVVTTLAGLNNTKGTADGVGTNARFESPIGIDVSGTIVYVADSFNNRIRQVDVETGNVTKLAGSLAGSDAAAGFSDGTGTHAKFNKPEGVAVSPDGGTLYVSEWINNCIRVVDVATGSVTTLAGSAGDAGSIDGIGTAARFNGLQDVTVSPNGFFLYVSDYLNNRIRKVVVATGEDYEYGNVTTLAGSGVADSIDGTSTAASFNRPGGVDTSPDGTVLYVAEGIDNKIQSQAGGRRDWQCDDARRLGL